MSIRPPIKSVTTGSSDISVSIETPETGKWWRLISVELHLSAAGGANNLTITRNSGDGAAYDANLKTVDMTSVTDYVWKPDDDESPVLLAPGDTLDFAWTNGSSRTYGLTVLYEKWGV